MQHRPTDIIPDLESHKSGCNFLDHRPVTNYYISYCVKQREGCSRVEGTSQHFNQSQFPLSFHIKLCAITNVCLVNLPEPISEHFFGKK